MYDFWHDYVKPKCGEKAKMCYMSTSNFMVLLKANDIDKGTAEVFKQGLTLQIISWKDHFQKERYWCDKSWNCLENRKLIYWIKSKNLVTYRYLMDEGSQDKNSKDTKNVSSQKQSYIWKL